MSKTRKKSDWKNSVFLKRLADIKKLKKSKGSDIQVWGSSKLIQLLLKNDLVDELRLKIYPLTLGKGKKLFDNGPIPAAFTLIESVVTTKGVIIASYKRAGHRASWNSEGGRMQVAVVTRVREFVQEVLAEFRKVTWPSRQELVNSTVVVIAVTVVLSLFLGGVDIVLARVVEWVLSGGRKGCLLYTSD